MNSVAQSVPCASSIFALILYLPRRLSGLFPIRKTSPKADKTKTPITCYIIPENILPAGKVAYIHLINGPQKFAPIKFSYCGKTFAFHVGPHVNFESVELLTQHPNDIVVVPFDRLVNASH